MGGLVIWAIGAKENAAKYLDFAGMIVSMVLAVIAILMPLIDGAGQKENMKDMKQSVEDMSATVKEVKSLLSETTTQLKVVNVIKDEILSNQIWQKQLQEQISALSSMIGGTGEESAPETEDIKERVQKLEKLVSKPPSKNSVDNLQNYSNNFLVELVLLKENMDQITLSEKVARAIGLIGSVRVYSNSSFDKGSIATAEIRLSNPVHRSKILSLLETSDFTPRDVNLL